MSNQIGNREKLLPEGVYRCQVEDVELKTGINQPHTKVWLKVIGQDQTFILFRPSNTVIEWNFIKKQNPIITIKIEHGQRNDYTFYKVSLRKIEEALPC